MEAEVVMRADGYLARLVHVDGVGLKLCNFLDRLVYKIDYP